MITNSMLNLHVYGVSHVLGESSINKIGEIPNPIALIFDESYATTSKVELLVKYGSLEKQLLQTDYIIAFSEHGKKVENSMTIEVITLNSDSKGNIIASVKGRTSEHLLERRILKASFYKTAYASTIIKDIIAQNCMTGYMTYEAIRGLPRFYIDNYPDTQNLGAVINYQGTYGNLLTEVERVCSQQNIGFKAHINSESGQNNEGVYGVSYLFKLFKGTDRSASQDVVDKVILDSDLSHMLSSEFYQNIINYRNYALVAGAGEGDARFKAEVQSEESLLFGYDLRELFVDARDLQQTTTDAEGNPVTLTNEAYENVLKQRGLEKLTELNQKVETYSFELAEPAKKMYNESFFLGDTVTLNDRNLNITIDTKLIGVSTTYSVRGKEMTFTFGNLLSSFLKRIK